MAKDKLNLSLGEVDTAKQANADVSKKQTKQAKSSKNSKKTGEGRPNFFARLAKGFREIISELKKVDWPPFRRTKNNPGVLANLGIVLVVVLFFTVVMTAFDSGLGALLKLLVGIK